MLKYEIDTKENKDFMLELRNELLAFGHGFPSPEGGAYYLGDDGRPMKERPRETWITCRMAHVYSMGVLLDHEGSAELADAALRGLRGELHDDKNGGWYAGRAADGGILPGKQCYAHAFVILAAASAILAKREGAWELYCEAINVYDRYFWDEDKGLAADIWDTEFKTLSDYRGINANMHTVETLLASYDVLDDPKPREMAGRIIEHVAGWAADNDWRIPEHFSKDWEPCMDYNKEKPDDPFKPYGATPGHGIEWARLIIQWAYATYGEDEAGAARYIDTARRLYDRAVKDAWNADGAPGFCYTTDWDGKPVVHDRMHWTLAEAINTSSVLYRVTHDKKYAGDYAEFMEYLDRYVIDHENGSWFHQLDSSNKLKETVWPGKADLYHAIQATLIPYSGKPGVSIAAAIKGTL